MRNNPKIKYRRSEHGGWEYTDGELWYLTNRTDDEVRLMCDLPIVPHEDDPLEVFGDTLDEPIPEDFALILLED